ncbi:hypothetical protein C8E87_7147 [Paractinoplanes brasiliensis]|uniref:Uncharacterized protein n=1 Tax=Paractinoplanes brasiliensis TaxID=52695 RepID=A0A4R6J835_9ACTN|nr:hypothetical protein C8E87_7147 [Actinoplanes brasiliensis]
MSSRRILPAAVTVIACALALIPGGAAQAKTDVSAQTQDDGWFRIKNVRSGLLLKPNTTESGVAVLQDVKGSNSSLSEWHQISDGHGYAQLVNGATSKWYALTVSNSVDWINRPVIAYERSSTSLPFQSWRIINNNLDQTKRIVNTATGKCLRMYNKSEQIGAQVYAYDTSLCVEGDNSLMWTFVDD